MAGQPAPRRIVVPLTGQAIDQGCSSGTVERVGTGLRVATAVEP
jgi:hypothetical protein